MLGYAATKAGLVAFTRSCATEFRNYRVRTSVILPGLTDTSFIPQKPAMAIWGPSPAMTYS